MPKESERKYRAQSYRKEWERESWAKGWLSVSKGSMSKAQCKLCQKDLACGKSELTAHARTSAHVRLAKNVEENHSIASYYEGNNTVTVRAELNMVALVARRNIPFSFTDHLLSTLNFACKDSNTIRKMSCNRTKTTYLMTECLSVYAHEKLVSDILNAQGVSILCDKATDISMNKTFCINVRFIKDDAAVTRLYHLALVDKDGGADGLFSLLSTALDTDGIGWDKIVGYASDGENLMQGRNNSFLTRMLQKNPDLYVLKCFCHSFHLVASHACQTLAKSAEMLVHDIYNYFKNSPNRKKSFEEFQHFFHCEPHRLLKPCQTRWLSLSQCVARILEQWSAVEMFFTAEAHETKSPHAERVYRAMKCPGIKATIEFMDYVLGDLTGLNTLFQSNEFKLHRLLPEVKRVVRMFCLNFMKRDEFAVETLNVDDEGKWLPLLQVYPGFLASETVKTMVPHEREGYLAQCRTWYREAIRQLLARIDLSDPVLKALEGLCPAAIVGGTASLGTASFLHSKFPRLTDANVHAIDRQWRSLLSDDDVIKGGWNKKSVADFWIRMSQIQTYRELAKFMLEITALPQSTAGVERTFSKVNNNKTKLRNALAVRTLEAIIRTSEEFPDNFDINDRLTSLHSKARSSYMGNYSSEEQDDATAMEIS